MERCLLLRRWGAVAAAGWRLETGTLSASVTVAPDVLGL